MHTDAKSLVISKEEFKSYSDVGKAFIALQTKMRKLLKKSDCGDLRRACITQMRNPGGAKLSQNFTEQISKTQNIDDLFDLLVLSPYWSWIDIRILDMMVVASENPHAVQLLNNYKDVVFSKKLIDLLPNAPSKKVKEEYYAIVVTKVNKDPNTITVADLLEFQYQLEVVIMDIQNGICILEHLEKGCIELHWYIPASCVDGAYQSARLRCDQFNDLHLQYLKIAHYPVIHDPLASPDLIFAPSPPVNVGKICNIILLACVMLFCHIATVKDFIDHYYEYLSVNIDAEVVTQLMVSQQILNEDIVTAASSSYQKNCLILQQVRQMNVQSLFSFSESLLTNHSQNHIGSTLIDGK